MSDFPQPICPADLLVLLSGFSSLASENVPLMAARGRVLAEDVICHELLPPFTRSTMDGYAVRAADTLSCSESEAGLLTVVGEIATGTSAQAFTLQAGQAVRIWTGGELPQHANAVVMVEDTRLLDGDTVAVFRSVAPQENLIRAGEDYAPGSVVLKRGDRLRPQDLGVLAGLGITTVAVYRRPRVAILSTGDELVPAWQRPPPGKIRDINSATLTALVEEAGGIAIAHGICGDDPGELLALCLNALEDADMLLLSGGSSSGKRDFTRRVFSALPGSQMLEPSVSLRPGKPTLLARQGNKALFGLPGPVASVLLIFYCVVRPLLRHYAGLDVTLGLQSIHVITGQRIASALGREDFVSVRLSAGPGALPFAFPVYGKSGLLSPLVRADGLLPIGRDNEGLDQGVESSVLLFP